MKRLGFTFLSAILGGASFAGGYWLLQNDLTDLPLHQGLLLAALAGIALGLLLSLLRPGGRRIPMLPPGQEAELLYRNLPVMLHATDRNGRLVEVNDCWLETLGYRRREVIGHKLADFIMHNNGAAEDEQSTQELFRADTVRNLPYRMVTRQGEFLDVLLSATLIRDTQKRPLVSLGTLVDMTEQKAAELEVEKLAYYDPLTGLPNRALFRDRLTQALAHARREGEELALFYIDVDRFKSVNDSLGHGAGDRLLQHLARRIGDYSREGDTVARLGGDEFTFIVTDVRDRKQIVGLAESLLLNTRRPVKTAGRDLVATVSIGIALFPHDGRDPSVLLRNADIAMYAAKQRGRNTFQFFSPDIDTRSSHKLDLELHLRRAIEHRQLFLLFHPQMDLRSGTISGAEALIRWKHPELGLVPPDQFIPLAEETGLIFPIGEWVLREACRQLKSWQREGIGPLRLGVNLSSVQFKTPEFVDMVEQVMEETGLMPGELEFELTESVLLENAKEAILTLVDLKIRGIQLAIDDFGTGYSSLLYLQNLPIDRLKIDREFIRPIPGDRQAEAITEAIIRLAHSLGMEVIAEGVEKEEQIAFLRAQGCAEIQGSYFHRPLSVPEFTDLLRRHSRRSATS